MTKDDLPDMPPEMESNGGLAPRTQEDDERDAAAFREAFPELWEKWLEWCAAEEARGPVSLSDLLKGKGNDD